MKNFLFPVSVGFYAPTKVWPSAFKYGKFGFKILEKEVGKDDF